MIVITGLDGSGKSSFLKKLQDELKDDVSILRVPFIESEKFKINKSLYDQCEFINYIGHKADVENLPSLKIIAMFGSMILFNQLYDELNKDKKRVFCERHPLIDTAVYAKVYHEVMHPDNLDLGIANELESKYKTEISSIVNCINSDIKISGKGQCYDLLSFLFDWFSKEENYSIGRLKTLFSISSPEAVYFLDAPAEELMSRIGDRSVKEYHETVSLLNKMRPVYISVLSQVDTPTSVVDTLNTDDLNRVFIEVLSGQ